MDCSGLLFFFFVIVPATCLLFIFSITYVRVESKKGKMEKIKIGETK